MKSGIILAAALFLSLSSIAQSKPVTPAKKHTASSVTRNTWSYETSKDEFEGTSMKIASIVAINTPDLGFPYHKVSLTLAFRDDSKEGLDAVMFLSGGIMDCENYRGFCEIDVKIDDKEPFGVAGSLASGNRGHFFIGSGDSVTLLRAIKESKKMVVRVPIYGHYNQDFTFNSAGITWEASHPTIDDTSGAQ